MRITLDVRERFEAKVRKTHTCWVWTAYCCPFGYGRLRVDGAPREAHRVAWELYCGPIPTGRHVLHECDNPPCVNPEHLFLGNQRSNVHDMLAKGRGSPPPTNAVLIEDQVREARRLRAAGQTYRQIAEFLGAAQSTIYYACTKRTWSDVD